MIDTDKFQGEAGAGDRAGYWEQGGCHMRGDPWKKERFRLG